MKLDKDTKLKIVISCLLEPDLSNDVREYVAGVLASSQDYNRETFHFLKAVAELCYRPSKDLAYELHRLWFRREARPSIRQFPSERFKSPNRLKEAE